MLRHQKRRLEVRTLSPSKPNAQKYAPAHPKKYAPLFLRNVARELRNLHHLSLENMFNPQKQRTHSPSEIRNTYVLFGEYYDGRKLPCLHPQI